MPESVRDRPSRCYENVFLLTKSKSYYYDAAAIAEPIAPTTAARYRGGRSAGHKYDGEVPGQGNLEAVTAQYVDVRLERKQSVLQTYHKALQPKTTVTGKEAGQETSKKAKKKSSEMEL